MNKSLGRDYDWSVANKQATIGRRWIQRRRPGLSAGEPNCRIEQFFAPRAHRLAIGRLFICGLLSKHNFPAFTLRDLSPDEAVEPSVPSQLLKLIFCAADLDLHRSYDALGGEKGKLSRRDKTECLFCSTSSFKNYFTCNKFASAGALKLEMWPNYELFWIIIVIIVEYSGWSHCKHYILKKQGRYGVTEFITSFTNKTFMSLCIFFLYCGVAKKKKEIRLTLF